jgi:hypothetical protein
MIGDEEVDSVEDIDQGTASFCYHCQRQISKKLGLKPRSDLRSRCGRGLWLLRG